MKCEQCGEEIKWSVLKLDLPCYASTKELLFCSSDCLTDWIDEHSCWEEVESDFDD